MLVNTILFEGTGHENFSSVVSR